jgi:hypothetical protein
MSKRRNLTVLIVLAVAVLIIGYAFFNARLLLIGPEITVVSPENGSSFDEPFIELHGKALHTAFISLNGQQVYVDETSTFRVPLVLAPGTSIMKLNARDRFDRETELTLWYTYNGPVAQPATHTIPALVATSSDAVATSSTATSSVDE